VCGIRCLLLVIKEGVYVREEKNGAGQAKQWRHWPRNSPPPHQVKRTTNNTADTTEFLIYPGQTEQLREVAKWSAQSSFLGLIYTRHKDIQKHALGQVGSNDPSSVWTLENQTGLCKWFLNGLAGRPRLHIGVKLFIQPARGAVTGVVATKRETGCPLPWANYHGMPSGWERKLGLNLVQVSFSGSGQHWFQLGLNLLIKIF
jgi:hypothetical protein